MGLLTLGQPLSWNETKKYAEHVRQHGIQQFVNLYTSRKSRTDPVLKWGDEIEYMVVKFDHESRQVRVSNRAHELLTKLQEPEGKGFRTNTLWRPEFGAYMVEGTPGQPYGLFPCPWVHATYDGTSDGPSNAQDKDGVDDYDDHREAVQVFAFLNGVETNMRLRRQQVQALLHENEAVLTISSFPRLGTRDFCSPPAFVHPTHGFARSLFFPDNAIYPGHPRFRTLANNIRERRGSPVEIYLPIYRDVNTEQPFEEILADSINVDPSRITLDQFASYRAVAEQRQQRVAKPNQVYMDAMGFGMGCCCLQVTFQAATLDEACHLYDQLTPLCPVLMALSAASPIFRGILTDVDCRWSVISSSVDDRTVAERTGINPNNGTECRQITKSRFDSVDLYISPEHAMYNDIEVCFEQSYFDQMVAASVSPSIAKHIAHLFIRDPLVLFKEKLDIDDTQESDHFENIQSTNWQTMRFKPPPMNSPEIGWRVEFRPMEVQLTDQENAAYVIFVVLLTRVILSFNLNILIPMSKVEENMKIAQQRDASRNGRFWFRSDLYLPDRVLEFVEQKLPNCKQTARQRQLSSSLDKDFDPVTRDTCCVQLTMDEIINGTNEYSECNFPGLVPMLHSYLDSMELDAATRCTLNGYMELISNRASGLTPTPARLMRDLVTTHPEYRQDSRVTESITYDLLKDMSRLQREQITVAQLVERIQLRQIMKH